MHKNYNLPQLQQYQTTKKVHLFDIQKIMYQPHRQFSIKRIQDYAFSKDKLLGKGAFGDVYLGFDEKHLRPVAIKTVSLQKVNQSHKNPELFFKKMSQEMINMQICKNEHLVQLIDPKKSQKNMYLICQYCNGGSLKNYLSAHGLLSQRQAIHFFKDILKGIYCLYDKKVVHRDLKPANILMHDFQLKIGDLGFSKSLDMHQQILTSIVGTPLYMSPQILMQKNYTEKTDVWSLGIILYEMLSGQAPWRVNSIQQIQQKIKQQPDINKLLYCSSQTKHLILRMLQYQQQKRIGLQQLFQHFPVQNNQMMDENSQKLQQVYKKTENHIAFSISLFILKHNNIKPIDGVSASQTAKQFIGKMIHHQKLMAQNQQFIRYYIALHSKIMYLMKVMMTCFEFEKELECEQIYGVMFLVLKYCNASIKQIILESQNQKKIKNLFKNNKGNYQEFKKSSYWLNYELLLKLDLQILQQFYKQFYKDCFLPIMQRKNPSNLIVYMNNNLNNFYDSILNQQIVTNNQQSIKLLQFWLTNFMHALFNKLRNLNNYSHNSQLFLSRIIFEFHRNPNTSLLQNIGVRVNILRKIQSWESDQNCQQWSKKIKQLDQLPIEDIKIFWNKQISANKLAMYQINFLEE